MSAQQRELLKRTIYNLGGADDCNATDLYAALAACTDAELEDILNSILCRIDR